MYIRQRWKWLWVALWYQQEKSQQQLAACSLARKAVTVSGVNTMPSAFVNAYT
jgi:hypothetical protein